MKKAGVFVLLLLLRVFCTADTVHAVPEDRLAALDASLSEMVQAYHIPGMAFFITDPDEIVFSRTYGQCESLGQNFFIGSMSKSYTALCVMQLQEQGLVDLDRDISAYLPEYSFSAKVTVRSLLNHTSGFDTHMKLSDVHVTDSYGSHEYANVNYDLLGKLIERVSGMTYEAYVQEHVFSPLGMADSLAKAEKARDCGRLLSGNRNYFGFFVQGDADYPGAGSWFHEPAGFLSVTPADHARYLRMYLNGGVAASGERIVRKESITSMWYDAVPLGPKQDAYYGMGWNSMTADGMRVVFHGGQVENYISYMFVLPDAGLAVCFMVNGNDEFGMNMLMDTAFWNSLACLQGGSPQQVHHASYVLIHLLLDAVYLLVLLLSLFLLLKAVGVRRIRANGTRVNPTPADELRTAPRRAAVIGRAAIAGRAGRLVRLLLGYAVWPFLLLTFTRLLFDTPLWVVKSFVPDLYGIIIAGSSLSLAAAAIRIATCLRKRFKDQAV